MEFDNDCPLCTFPEESRGVLYALAITLGAEIHIPERNAHFLVSKFAEIIQQMAADEEVQQNLSELPADTNIHVAIQALIGNARRKAMMDMALEMAKKAGIPLDEIKGVSVNMVPIPLGDNDNDEPK